MIKYNDSASILLENFEGPIELLWQLIQKGEMDLLDVWLSEITEQYKSKLLGTNSLDLDAGAEFTVLTACLILAKSKLLLPKHEQEQEQQEEEDPHFEVIHQLIDYCRFKQAAKSLTEREMEQSIFYSRGGEALETKKPLGIEHISLQDLASLFEQILARSSTQRGNILDETWRVSDKILLIRELLCDQQKIAFELLFSPEHSREELITTFLAILELMKIGELKVIRDLAKDTIMITAAKDHV